MKLVFYDGAIDYFTFVCDYIEKIKELKYLSVNVADGKFGISYTLNILDNAFNKENETETQQLVLTNSIDLLNYVNFRDIYLITNVLNKNGSLQDYDIKTLQECCDKELRDCHDIRKLYLSGAFGEVYQIKNEKKRA